MFNKKLPFKIREDVSDTSLVVKTLTLFAFFLLFSVTTNAQSLFKTESDAVKFMEGKTFVNRKVRISYGHISKLNTYGFTVIDALGRTLHFTNCKFIPCGHYCDIILEKGYGKGRYRLFPDRLVSYYDMGLSNFSTFFISEE